MRIIYRLHCESGYMPDERRSFNSGVVKVVRTTTPKQRPANYSSECDWIVPGTEKD